jgi:hypothetical protein
MAKDILENLKRGTDDPALSAQSAVALTNKAITVSAKLGPAVMLPRDEFSAGARAAVGEYKVVLPLAQVAATWMENMLQATPEERRLFEAGAIAGAMCTIAFLEATQVEQ